MRPIPSDLDKTPLLSPVCTRYGISPSLITAASIAEGKKNDREGQMEKLIDEKQLAAITGLALQTLRNQRHQRRGIPYIRLGSGQRAAIRYDLQDVELFLQKHRIDPEAMGADR